MQNLLTGGFTGQNNLMAKSTKAILIPETIKIIIAVICIFLLIYLAVSLYGIFISKSEIEQARATLDAIIGKINSLDNDGEKLDYFIIGPEAWNIYYFDNVAGVSLTTCGGENCLCSCPQFNTREEIPAELGKCISLGGICSPVKNISFNSICDLLVEENSLLPIKDISEVRVSNCFNIGRPPVKISIEKSGGIIRFVSITSSNSDIENIVNLLSFKQNKDSQTVGQLIFNFINESKKPENNVPGGTPSLEYIRISSNLTSSIESFAKLSGKDYWILRVKEKISGKTILTRGDTLFEDVSTVIWSTTDTYTIQQESIEYQILFKTGVKWVKS